MLCDSFDLANADEAGNNNFALLNDLESTGDKTIDAVKERLKELNKLFTGKASELREDSIKSILFALSLPSAEKKILEKRVLEEDKASPLKIDEKESNSVYKPLSSEE